MRGWSRSIRSSVATWSLTTLAATAWAQTPPNPPPSTTPPTIKAPAASFEFISPARAARRVEQNALQTIDARSAAKYLAGHIAGAISLRDEQLREARAGLPTAILSSAELAALFGRLGIDPAIPVMVYADSEDPLAATLVAYGLLKAGHRNISVLDGGFSAWTGPTSQDYPDPAAKSWDTVPPGEQPATLGDTIKAHASGETALLDARPPKFFRGETRAWKRNGHIPGALSLDWHLLVASDNEALLKPASEIAELLAKPIYSKLDPAIIYCGTGREATLLYLHLRYLSGWSKARLFEGSWTQWQSDPARPIATGAEERAPVWSDGEVTLSGQPTADVLRELADRGIKTIVNCRTIGEISKMTFSERALAESLGITYAEIPLGGPDGYETEDVQALAKIIDDRGMKGLHLHCSVGSRAANLWAAYLVNHEKLSPAQAIERLRASGAMKETSLERLLGEQLLPVPAPTPTPPTTPATPMPTTNP